MIEILGEYGREDLAKVYVASMRGSKEHLVEFVESVQQIAEFADMMTNGVPVGCGIINGEEPDSCGDNETIHWGIP